MPGSRVTNFDPLISGGKEDADFIVTERIESYKDPFTKKIIQDPVRSRTCNHYFERSAVTRHIKSGRQRYFSLERILNYFKSIFINTIQPR